MKSKFTLPETPTCRVIYERNGVKYAAVISTPKSNDDLVTAMLSRQVGLSQVKNVEGIAPRRSTEHYHPAHRQIDRYSTMTA